MQAFSLITHLLIDATQHLGKTCLEYTLNKSSFTVQLLTFAPILLVPAVVFALAMLVLGEQEKGYQTKVAQLESDFLYTEKARVRSKVNNMVDLVSYRQSIVTQELHTRIQRRVDDAHVIAQALYDFYKNSKSDDEIKRLIVESLRALSWNNGESYIWLIDFQGNLQLGPDYLQKMEGQSILSFEDANGRKVIEEEIAIVTTQGKGFLWDTFTKPGYSTDKQFKQLAYLKQLGMYDWYLGSAEFLDTATKSTESELLQTINQVGKGDSDYIFVIDSDGDLLLNYARPDIVGRNMSETNDKNLHALFNKMVAAGQSDREEFITYNWINPITGMVDSKVAYLKEVPNSNWIIGSGFYPKMLEQGYDVKLQKLTTEHTQKTQHLTTLMWLSVFTALVLSIFISLLFYRVIKNYKASLEFSRRELKDLNLQLEQSLIEKGNELLKVESELKRSQKNINDENTIFVSSKITLSRLEEEIQRAWVYKLPLTVLRLTLEKYKKLQDFSTQQADMLLETLANQIQNVTKDTELCCLVSDNEILIITPGLNAMQAKKQVEYIIDDMVSFNIAHGIDVNFYFKKAEYEQEDSAQQLLKKLDE